jgi:hypothetical protein
VGLLIGGLCLAVQAWALHTGHAHWQTMVFTVLTLAQMAHVLAIRSETEPLWRLGLLSNRPLLGAVLLTFALQMATIYVPCSTRSSRPSWPRPPARGPYFHLERHPSMQIETLAVHGGYTPDPTTKSAAVPLYQTVAYAFDSAQHGADLFDLKVPGNIYTRIMNPTTDVLEKRVAALEGGMAALAMASGMAAITAAIQTIAETGDNIVSASTLYGGTYNLFAHTFPQQGIEVRFADPRDPASFAKLIDARTKAVFCESIGNPLGNVTDIAALAKVAHDHGVPLIVDNTVPSPYLCRPIEHGADIVVHALTKYMNGHGNSIGGIIVDSGKFPWAEHKERFKRLNEPDVSYHGVVYTEALGPPPSSAARAWCRCATWARRSRRSTPGSRCRASRPCRCAWTASATTPWRWPRPCKPTPRWNGCATPDCPTTPTTPWCSARWVAALRAS